MPPAVATGDGVDKSNDRVQRMFGEIAPRYDLLNHLLSLNIDRYWRRRTVRLVPPSGDAPILDLCTGTGDLALAYERAASGRLAITGSDFCPEMLTIARKKGEAAGVNDHVSWVEADAQALPFESDAYQIVSVAFGLRNVADTDQGLREMARVCRPGGKVAVLEFTTPRRQPLRGLYGWYFRNVLPRIGQALARNNSAAYEYLPQSVGQFYEYEQLTERMEAAGLRDVKFHPMTFGVATLYVGTK
ncbi:UbiE/COQ5 methyltransferase [Posidoniimonas corsicana]|uniref:Demethylmenaquinone methyltransferase n=1 Tax=Posidoniimonas corsicana TaxID=1938618 RepID=A0A5C5UXF7_9BACT|nr:bifunctional demethylmenaquinone methyltransferase/2-methoxy-6-polyprenyl-1,4-benzoquinol methylase UbiE [Posidoniimonas corsicana]TWT30300.1 UbiE/COQ5 methyltransferase [Posidoniimonas corsicana]